MCSFKTLHHSANGYIVQCKACSLFQIAFGTVAFTLNKEGLDDFSVKINDYYQACRDKDRHDQKIIGFPTPLPSLVLALSVTDVIDIREMLSETYAMIELETILAVKEN